MIHYIKDYLDTSGCYTVGYDNQYGVFEPEFDFQRYDDAEKKCNELNGITTKSVKTKEIEISLRDYFAAKAMQSLVTAYETDEFGLPKKIALRAYEYADAMLQERSKSNE